ncbi:MAG: alpha/beta fold hydrolase [Chloroflexota bacterium]
MPFVNNRGVRIHYELEGKGLPLVFMHGFTGSLEDWRMYGYTEELGKDYRLVLIDARGHGKSDKPHDAKAYQPELFGCDITAVMDDRNIKKALFMGYSMGGRVGFSSLARYSLDRFYCLILGGKSPYGYGTQAKKEAVRIRLASLEKAAREGNESYIAYLEARDGLPLSDARKAQLRASDLGSLIAIQKAFIDWPDADDLMPEMKLPCLLYSGELDEDYPVIKKSAGMMPNAKFFSLPGLNHTACYQHSELVLPYVKKFLAEVSRNIK